MLRVAALGEATSDEESSGSDSRVEAKWRPSWVKLAGAAAIAVAAPAALWAGATYGLQPTAARSPALRSRTGELPLPPLAAISVPAHVVQAVGSRGLVTQEKIPTAEEDVPTFATSDDAFHALDSDGDGYVHLGGNDSAAVTIQEYKAIVEAEATSYALVDSASEPTTVTEADTFRQIAKALVKPRTTDIVMKPKYRPMTGSAARVAELYTFGAPATTLAGVFDAQSPNGCMPGLRVVTQAPEYVKAADAMFVKSDPVPSILDFMYKHGLMDYMPASANNMRVDPMRSCQFFADNPMRLMDTPKWDHFWWLNGHMIYPGTIQAHLNKFPTAPKMASAPNDLELLVKEHTPVANRRLQIAQNYANFTEEEKVERANMMARLVFSNYGRKLQAVMMEWGWRMVARANAATDEGTSGGLLGLRLKDYGSHGKLAVTAIRTVDSFTDGFGDHMMMYQHETTLECVLIFEGSKLNDAKDWLSNLNFATTEFCGFGPTHKGFRAKLMRMVAGIDYRQTIHRLARHCSKITVAGHSLGGAQAELFAACANNPVPDGEPGALDHRMCSLTRATPKLLEPFLADHAQGSFIRNKGNGLCIDVVGSATTTYRFPVIMYYCELPDSDFSKDQQWDHTPEGRFVSRLTGMCMDGRTKWQGSGAVTQRKCEPSNPEADQAWHFTTDGFLRSNKTGHCLDNGMKAFPCPVTDQLWEMEPSGALRNTLSGKCVAALPNLTGHVGLTSALALAECDLTNSSTARWQFKGGLLMHVTTGLCAAKVFLGGEVRDPPVSLRECEGGAFANSADHWLLTAEGFVKSVLTARCMNVDGAPGIGVGSTLNVAGCEDKGIVTTGLWRLNERGFLVNLGAGESQHKCVEIFGTDKEQKKTEGAELWLDFCEVNSDQKWQITPGGFIKNVIGGQKCLSIHHERGMLLDHSHRRFWLDNCADPDDPALEMPSKWFPERDGRIINKFSRRCLAMLNEQHHIDIEGRFLGLQQENVTSKEVALDWCNDLNHSRVKWDMLQDGTIRSRDNGWCLDEGATLPGETLIIARPCSVNETSQYWQLTASGFLKNLHSGQCTIQSLDLGTPEGMRAVTKPCPHHPQMKWKVLPTGQIQNQATQKCLDAPHPGQLMPDGSPMPHYQLTEWECDATRDTQRWETIQAPKAEL